MEATDLVLPGRNGFDLRITRIYDSLAADAAYRDGDKRRLNSFGQGWTLDLPALELNDNGQSVKLHKGTTYAYDARNRLVAETDALGNTTTYTYLYEGVKPQNGVVQFSRFKRWVWGSLRHP